MTEEVGQVVVGPVIGEFADFCRQLRELEDAYGGAFGVFDELLSEGTKALVAVGFSENPRFAL